MARYTKEQLLEKLEELSAKEKVFRAEVSDFKYHVSRVYDEAKEKVKDKFRWAGRWESLSAEENAIEIPYSLQHLFGKKFPKSIETARAAVGTTPYLEALENLQAELAPIHNLFQALIARQISGRRPAEPKEVIGTREQLRAICPCCFRQHAVNGNRMVSHGYTLDYGFQNGICSGHNKPHFGTPEGRDITAASAKIFHESAVEGLRIAGEIRAGNHPIFEPKTHKKIETPTQYQIKAAAENQEGSSRNQESYAKMLDAMVTKWEPKEPQLVQIDITK